MVGGIAIREDKGLSPDAAPEPMTLSRLGLGLCGVVARRFRA